MSIEEMDRVVELRAQGKTLQYIASEIGVCHMTIWRRLNPVATKDRRIQRRANHLQTYINGVKTWIKVQRRPNPGSCELCGNKVNKMDWHHWDDTHSEWGLWLCSPCHQGAEFIDRGERLVGKYLSLRRGIEVPADQGVLLCP